ncbi:carbon-nitrogen hydrolase [Clavulina sp. PMI_390]|nr:carbon-nitrogen hydrolase [Clavulina sp. PMI_390]
MSRRILAALAQLTSTPDVSHNLKTAVSLIKRAREAGASILFLPEATDFIAPAAKVLELSQPIAPGQNEFVDGIIEAAREAGIFVNVGVHELPVSTDSKPDRCYNTNLLISNEGTILSSYRKVHLFDVDLAPDGPTIKESNTTIPGDELTAPVVTPVGLLGLQTCFDVRFSDSARALVQKHNVTALTYPSAFAERTGAAHWEVLLRARAIENQCYVFGSAQTGEHFPGRRSYGYAMIVDPWGTVIAQCAQVSPPSATLCVAEIDHSFVAKIRREIPMGWNLKEEKR